MPRHNEFSNLDMRDMISVYAQEDFCGRAAARRYSVLYPNRRQPDHKLFKNLYDRLGETGSFRPKSHNGRPKMITPDQEEDVLVRVAEDTQISTRRLSAATLLSRASIHRTIQKENLYPYHFTPVQSLIPVDYPARLQFSRFLLNKHNDDPTFLKKILFTDEATFTRRGIFNWRNSHSWELENPHLPRVTHFQHEFSINVWCGIIGNCFIGPHELPARLNGDMYLHFLENTLEELLDDVPLNLRHNYWFMQDGAPAHFQNVVRDHLNHRFPHRWIGRGSEFPWPPRSPDLNPLDFYFWGHMKSIVYEHPVNTRAELWLKIQEAANSMRNDQESIGFKVRRSLTNRLRKCVEKNGAHFENLLK